MLERSQIKSDASWSPPPTPHSALFGKPSLLSRFLAGRHPRVLIHYSQRSASTSLEAHCVYCTCDFAFAPVSTSRAALGLGFCVGCVCGFPLYLMLVRTVQLQAARTLSCTKEINPIPCLSLLFCAKFLHVLAKFTGCLFHLNGIKSFPSNRTLFSKAKF